MPHILIVEDDIDINNIRSKLRPSGTDEYIQTAWGIGSAEA